MCYNDFVKSARSLRLPAVALEIVDPDLVGIADSGPTGKKSALQTMLARLPRASMGRAVFLTAPEADVRLPTATPLESTLVARGHFAQFLYNITPFRINTCKSVSKQMTLTPFRINTYEKHGAGGGSPQRIDSLFR